jgi:hypothetical protein
MPDVLPVVSLVPAAASLPDVAVASVLLGVPGAVGVVVPVVVLGVPLVVPVVSVLDWSGSVASVVDDAEVAGCGCATVAAAVSSAVSVITDKDGEMRIVCTPVLFASMRSCGRRSNWCDERLTARRDVRDVRDVRQSRACILLNVRVNCRSVVSTFAKRCRA